MCKRESSEGGAAEDVQTESKRFRSAIDEMAEELVCPITQELPVDPVTAMDGHVYERSAIEEWFVKGNGTSPKTGAKMGSTLLTAHHVKNMLERMVKSGALSGDKADAWQQRLSDERKVQETRRHADDGDKVAMYAMGALYLKGTCGVKKDLALAAHWLQLSANAGHLVSMVLLGTYYLTGHVVSKNTSVGASMLTEAATLGSELGCFFLGRCYVRGVWGFPIDFRQAERWYRKMPACTEQACGDKNRESVVEWLQENCAA